MVGTLGHEKINHENLSGRSIMSILKRPFVCFVCFVLSHWHLRSPNKIRHSAPATLLVVLESPAQVAVH
jgi:hypothetical protein